MPHFQIDGSAVQRHTMLSAVLARKTCPAPLCRRAPMPPCLPMSAPADIMPSYPPTFPVFVQHGSTAPLADWGTRAASRTVLADSLPRYLHPDAGVPLHLEGATLSHTTNDMCQCGMLNASCIAQQSVIEAACLIVGLTIRIVSHPSLRCAAEQTASEQPTSGILAPSFAC